MGVQDFAYNGATANIRLGRIKIPCLKVAPPKESVKTEKIRRLGEQVATARTLGIYEVDQAKVTLEIGVHARYIEPRLPVHSGNIFEFPVTFENKHPQMGKPYSRIWDRTRIVGIEEEASEADEKATKMDLVLECMNVWFKGDDGIWTSLAVQPGKMSEAAQQLANFGF